MKRPTTRKARPNPKTKAMRRQAKANRKPNGRKRAAKRRNPDEQDAELSAAEMSEKFHGRPARTAKDYEELEASRRVLADLGKLVELQVWVDDDEYFALSPKGVRLACSPNGGQLYFVGGDQALDLRALGLDRYLPKDHVRVGEVQAIAYYTSKAFHDFEPSTYEHNFGEGEELPVLCYDVLNQRLYLTGGSYRVKPAGITD